MAHHDLCVCRVKPANKFTSTKYDTGEILNHDFALLDLAVVEPRCDIAVLRSPDDDSPEQEVAGAFFDSIEPVPVCFDEIKFDSA